MRSDGKGNSACSSNVLWDFHIVHNVIHWVMLSDKQKLRVQNCGCPQFHDFLAIRMFCQRLRSWNVSRKTLSLSNTISNLTEPWSYVILEPLTYTLLCRGCKQPEQNYLYCAHVPASHQSSKCVCGIHHWNGTVINLLTSVKKLNAVPKAQSALLLLGMGLAGTPS
jgi:hypothetical protein